MWRFQPGSIDPRARHRFHERCGQGKTNEMNTNTIVDVMLDRARTSPERIAFTFLEDSGGERELSFGALRDAAQRVADSILGAASPQDRVLLLVPQGVNYITAFWGCLLAGVVAVPLYPPGSRSHTTKLDGVLDDCDARLIITDAATQPNIEQRYAQGVAVLVIDAMPADAAAPAAASRAVTRDDLAFLQYTSGSTGDPKGVMISHGNIVANLDALMAATGCHGDDVFCNWLPLFHDLGLINTLLLPVYMGAHSVLMTPARFMKRPAFWLQAITRFRATIAGAPNFAYEHCARRIKHLDGIDLSTWRIAFNAAEPIDHDVLRAFDERYQGAGFARNAFYPSYGMAEATVFVAGGDPAQEPTVTSFSQVQLHGGRAVESSASHDSVSLVACGRACPQHELRIVCPDTHRPLDVGHVGEIWFRGASVSQGYWGAPQKNAAAFATLSSPDGDLDYLRTGDLGFVFRDQLYIAGRIKDLIIIKGKNYYPQDIEKVAWHAHPSLRYGSCVAFEASGRFVVVQEVETKFINSVNLAEAASAIRASVFEHEHVLLTDVLLVRPGVIPRTSSGKVRRRQAKAGYLEGRIGALYTLSDAVAPTEYAEPETGTERWLIECWTTVLEADAIGRNCNFFSAGGQSLSAARLLHEVRARFSVELTIKQLFDHPTVAELAALIDGHAREKTRLAAPAHVETPVSPSSGQKQLYFLYTLDKGNPQYNIARAFDIRGKLQVQAFDEAFRTIVYRHSVLRTTYHQEGGRISCRLHDGAIPGIRVVDVGDPSVGAGRARKLVREAMRTPFDLETDVMARCLLIRFGDDAFQAVFVFHHIAVDGWSLGILCREISTLYSALAEGRAAELPDVGLQYADFAHWQNARITAGAYARESDYWARLLAGAPLVHNLPLDHVRPTKASFRGRSLQRTLPAAQVRRLRGLAQRHNGTLFMVVYSALACLLHRYSGDRDVVIGVPVSNRTQALDGVVGFIMNPLVTRCRIAGNSRFVELLEQNREMLLEAYSHAALPYELLVEQLRPERSLGYNPLFQVMLSYQNIDEGALVLPPLETELVATESISSNTDLALYVDDVGDALSLRWEYATDLFEHATIRAMASHFDVLLQAIVADERVAVSKLQILAEDERYRLLSEWNDTDAAFDPTPLPRSFARQAQRSPDAPALVSDEVTWSYAELDRRSASLAARLRQIGIGSGSFVGVCLDHSARTVLALLGILRAGAAYVPLDPMNPRNRIASITDDCPVSLVICQSDTRERIDAALPTLLLDSALQEFGGEETAGYASDTDPADLMYVAYTSGTTGAPKGVQVTHANVANFLQAMARRHPLKERETVFAITQIGFDIHVLELFLPLVSGACVEIASAGAARDPFRLARRLNAGGIRLMQATPATWQMLVNCGDWAGSPHLSALCGGEALTAGLADALRGRVERLWNLYGPTETTVWSCCIDLTHERGAVTIGTPIDNTRIYVLNEAMEPQPTGVFGELYIGGAGVARGYLNRPELTAHKFVRDPFSADPAQIVYRTGDVARWRAGGNLEFRGRQDSQVKIRGFRVELGEIEAHLDAIDAVEACAVVVEGSSLAEKRPVAYVVARSDSVAAAGGWSALKAALLERLGRELPAHMIPGALRFVQQLPLSLANKVDRQALSRLPCIGSDPVGPQPGTETERALAAVWAEILRCDVADIGADDGFFGLGGNSLLSMRLIAEANKRLGASLSVSDVFQHATLRAMAARIQEGAGSGAAPAIAPGESANRYRGLSGAQQRIWFVDRLGVDRHLFNMPKAFTTSSGFDVDAAERALRDIVERHHVLRSVFTVENDEVVQDVRLDGEFAVSRVDLSAIPAATRDDVAREWIENDAAAPFDLETDHLLRAAHLQFGDGSGFLVVNLHHIASDAWSVDILIDEFVALYRLHTGQSQDRLPKPRLQYADHAERESRLRSSECPESKIRFWRERLAGIPTVHGIHLDGARGAGHGAVAATHRSALGAEHAQAMRAFCRARNATFFMAFQACFAVLVARWSGETDIVIGAPDAGRDDADTHGVMGPFVNNVVYRSRLDDNPTFEALMSRTIAQHIESRDQSLPFETLVGGVNPARSLLHAPIFQLFLNPYASSAATGTLKSIGLSESDHGALLMNRYDLTLYVDESSDDVSLCWAYNGGLFAESTIVRMAQETTSLFGRLVAHPDRPVLDHTWHSPERWMDAASAGDDGQRPSYLQRFEAAVERYAERDALVVDGRAWTFRALDEQANRYAQFLRDTCGVGYGSRVAIAMGRSGDRIAAMIGVSKLGAAYVPLSGDLPVQRLRFMLEDSAAAAAIVDAACAGVIAECVVDLDVTIVNVDDAATRAGLAQCSGARPGTADYPRDTVAHIIFTSGSTGRPKGVMGTFGATTNRVSWMLEAYPFAAGERFAHITSFAFIRAVWELWVPLCGGATLEVFDRDVARQPEHLIARLADRRVSRVVTTPSLLRSVVAAAQEDGRARQGCPIRYWFVSGEAFPAKVADAAMDTWKETRFVNLYGSTEVLSDVLVNPLDGRCADEFVGMGRPIANTGATVVDRKLNPVPRGVVGELVITGDNVAAGYAANPALTARMFVDTPAGRGYRTGDLVRKHADGTFEYIGRNDDQVKVRGYRVELLDIQAQLEELPYVRAAAVVALDSGNGDKKLVAYLVTDVATASMAMGGERLQAIREDLAQRLPAYMIPMHFVEMPWFPLTANGKLDRKALPALQEIAPAERSTPLSRTETVLVAIWSDVLRLHESAVDTTTSFFGLGGHSLLVGQVIARIRTQLTVELSYRDFFTDSTIQGVARLVDARAPRSETRRVVLI
ncbi:MAG: hypothetical protein AMXMBFR59_34540 [Rhodanobacteraceae bacterium]